MHACSHQYYTLKRHNINPLYKFNRTWKTHGTAVDYSV